MYRLIFILALAAAPVAAQESLTLFGIPFNEPLSVPECPWRVVRDYTSQDRKAMKREYSNTSFSDSLCFIQPATIGQGVTDGALGFVFPLLARPSMGHISGRVVEGRLQRLQIRTRGISTQVSDLETLTTKFGPPTTLNRPSAQNRMGATFETLEAQWKLSDGTAVIYGSALSNLNEGIVIISTPAGDAAQAAADAEFKRRFGGTQL